MSTYITNAITIAAEDYDVLNEYIKGIKPIKAFDRVNAAVLQQELKRATVVKNGELPDNVVRLNSRVKIKEVNNGRTIEIVLVVPEKADIRQGMVSVFAPIGTALIGFKQGEKVSWNVPAGTKTFSIMEVDNFGAKY